MLEIAANHDVVRLDDASNPVLPGSRPRVVVTFDDAYRGAVHLAVAELARLGLPGTLFVAPGCLGLKSFWWDRYAPAQGWPPEIRAKLLTECAGRDDRVGEWALQVGQLERNLSEWYCAATEAELKGCLRHPGIEFGSHSWSHVNLALVEGHDLNEEVMRPFAWLRRSLERVVPWLAYPYGLAARGAASVARANGLVGALRVSGGWWPQGPQDVFLKPRWNVPAGLSLNGFRIRLAGVLCR
jgi:peptidoglycan/xylan/chitin deacetylase (PgdA/CDA1 family)